MVGRRTCFIGTQHLEHFVGAAVDVGSVEEGGDLVDLVARSQGAVLVRRRTGAHKVHARHVELAVERVALADLDRHAVRMLLIARHRTLTVAVAALGHAAVESARLGRSL